MYSDSGGDGPQVGGMQEIARKWDLIALGIPANMECDGMRWFHL
jgi:hypothetical protein